MGSVMTFGAAGIEGETRVVEADQVHHWTSQGWVLRAITQTHETLDINTSNGCRTVEVDVVHFVVSRGHDKQLEELTARLELLSKEHWEQGNKIAEHRKVHDKLAAERDEYKKHVETLCARVAGGREREDIANKRLQTMETIIGKVREVLGSERFEEIIK